MKMSNELLQEKLDRQEVERQVYKACAELRRLRRWLVAVIFLWVITAGVLLRPVAPEAKSKAINFNRINTDNQITYDYDEAFLGFPSMSNATQKMDSTEIEALQKAFPSGRVHIDRVQKYQDEKYMIAPNCLHRVQQPPVSGQREEEAALRFAATQIK